MDGILRNSKLPEDNITKENQNVLKEMRSWKDEVILPADKGNATVVMESEDYDRNVRELLYLPQATKRTHTNSDK